MTPDRPTPPPSRPGRSEPWRIERMVQRVPAHLGENQREPVSGWVMIGGLVLLVLVSCVVLSILIDFPSRLAGLGAKTAATSTRTPRVVTPAITILPVTLPPATATPGPTATTVKYKVKAGDNLTGIAARYHITIQAIMIANGLKDETIRAGEELIIPLPTPTPPAGALAPSAPGGATPIVQGSTPTTIALLQSPPTSTASGSTPGVIRHTVSRGDTLVGVAAIYGSTVDAIRMANQLASDALSIGQVLLVPVGAWSPTPPPTSVVVPTVTPTLQFAYNAPSLIWPPDGQTVRGKDGGPTLQWVPAASIKPDESYVIHVDYTVGGQKKSIVRQVRQGTSIQLAAADYPGANPNGTQFTWYVVVVSQPKARADQQNAQASASSPPSERRLFVWY